MYRDAPHNSQIPKRKTAEISKLITTAHDGTTTDYRRFTSRSGPWLFPVFLQEMSRNDCRPLTRCTAQAARPTRLPWNSPRSLRSRWSFRRCRRVMSCLEACGSLPTAAAASSVQSQQQVVGFNGFEFNAALARSELNRRRVKLIRKRLRPIRRRVVSENYQDLVRWGGNVKPPCRQRKNRAEPGDVGTTKCETIFSWRSCGIVWFVQIKMTSLSMLLLLFFFYKVVVP